MSAVTRRPVGDPVLYRGSPIIARYIGPDLLCEVDGFEAWMAPPELLGKQLPQLKSAMACATGWKPSNALEG